MKLLPRAVQTLITSTPDATRVRDGITAAVQPTLDFLNGFFKSAADGSLQIVRDVAVQGAFSVAKASVFNGAFKLLGDFALTGNFYAKVRTGNGFVIQSGAVGPTFYVTNVGGTQAVFLVYSDGGVVAYGGVNAPNFISGAGFKTAIDIGTVWNTSAGAGAYYQTIKAVVNQANGSLGSTPFIFKFPYAGSIVGWSLNNAGPDLGTLGLRYYRNGALIGNPLTGGGGGNNATFWGTHAKGQFSFAAGDTLTVFLGCSNAGNFQASAQLTLEMSA